tara:strand:- start:1230 stop:1727 length:498 start_codon:yes stop_codon:yes gene_type:complete
MFYAQNEIKINTTLFTNDLTNLNVCDQLKEEISKFEKNQWVNDTGVKTSKDNFFQNNKIFQTFITSINNDTQQIVNGGIVIKSVSVHQINKDYPFKKKHNKYINQLIGLLFLDNQDFDGVYFNDFGKLIPEKKGRYIIYDSCLNYSFLENTSDTLSNVVCWIIDY